MIPGGEYMSETNPIELVKTLRSTLERYIPTTLPISRRYPNLQKAFSELVKKQSLVKGPYVEALPDFEKGKSLRQCIRSQGGFLHDGFLNLKEHILDRLLHLHQEKAITAACREGQSLIVATGTGSGKTETFLYPIAHGLLEDKESDAPGVRVLLIYPMNALANDQLFYRIAPLFGADLAQYGITFGRYTSQIRANTPREEEEYKLKDNLKLMEALDNKIPLNWKLTREDMLEDPPKILITNYAMLEHLLLLPRNAPLFAHDALQAVVLDEIHTYSGAQATEVAFLLRKLKNRLGSKRPFQVFGTSATLASGKGADEKLLEFASSLFGEDVHQVVRGKRIPHPRLSGKCESAFSLTANQWVEIGNILKELAKEENPESADWNEYIGGESLQDSIFLLDEDQPFSQALEDIFRANKEIRDVVKYLDRKTIMDFQELAKAIFQGEESEKEKFEALSALMHLGMRARISSDSFPLLPSRYHIAANSIEGVCVRLNSHYNEGWTDLKPHRNYLENNHTPYYPLMVCRRCGQPYIEGYSDNVKLYNSLKALGADDQKLSRKIYWLGEPPQSKTRDESDEELTEEEGESEFIDPDTGKFQDSDKSTSVCLYEVKTAKDDIERTLYVRTCPACGGRASGSQAEIISQMHPGDEALGAVVVQKVLEAVPEAKEMDEPKPMQGRTLLSFSDNRQAAAYFAPYFERTSGGLAFRTAIYQALRKDEEPLNFEDLADFILKYWRRFGEPIVFDANGNIIESRQRRHDQVIGLTAAEFCTPGGRRNSLEALGLVKVSYEKGKLKRLTREVKKFIHEGYEAHTDSLIHILLETIRREKAISNPYDLDMKDPFIWSEAYKGHRAFEIFKGNPKISHAWIPQEGTRRHNRRTWYLVERLNWSWEDARVFLQNFWQTMLDLRILVGLKPGFGLDAKLLRFTLGEKHKLYYCQDCGIFQFETISNCCVAFRCRGNIRELSSEDQKKLNEQNHYIYTFRQGKALTTRAREHTASLSTELRQNIEQEFSEKKVNLLSCTTTMEMGVDLGELEAIACLNIPPGISNYQQRTGRAGRRAQAAPFCVTIARNSQYDQAVYKDFKSYLEQPAPIPNIHLANAQLFQRHQNSVILSAFLRHRIRDLSTNAPGFGDLFGDKFGDEEYRAFRDDMFHWIEESEGIKALEEAEKLGTMLPPNIKDQIALRGKAVQSYFTKQMEVFATEVRERWELYTEKREEYMKNDQPKPANYWDKLRSKYMKQFLVNQLSLHGMIPTYSFPVHSLTLEVIGEIGGKHDFSREKDVSLNRDAILGISEYAPGAEVVANGRIWTSEGLASYPRMFMPTRYYTACPECQHVDVGEDKEDVPKLCSCCGSIERRQKRSFIEPRGFVTAYKNRKGKDPSLNRIRKQFADEARLISLARNEHFTTSDNPIITKALLRGHSINDEDMIGTLFIVNRGPFGLGYHRCLCNYMIPAKKFATVTRKHTELNSERQCSIKKLSWPLDMAHIFHTDVCIFRFNKQIPLPNNALFRKNELRKHFDSFSRTLSEGFRFAASELLNVQAREIRSAYKINDRYLETIIYDSVPGGAGYSVRLFNEISVTDLLNAVIRRLYCPNECSTACRVCLCDYSNQRMWDIFDRKPVLSWLKKMSSQETDHPIIRIGGTFWESPSYEMLAEKLNPFKEVHLIGRTLSSNKSNLNGKGVRWLLDTLNNGDVVHIHLSDSLETEIKKLTPQQRRIFSYLKPYIEEGKLVLRHLNFKKNGSKFPRVFPRPDAGRPLWFTDYPVPSLLEDILPKPVYQLLANEDWVDRLKELIENSEPYSPDIFQEDSELERWELRPNQHRDYETYFHAVKSAHLEEMIIRDPYCGAGYNQIQKLAQFINTLNGLADTIKKVKIYCKEQNPRSYAYEIPSKIRENMSESLKNIIDEKKLNINVRDRILRQKFFASKNNTYRYSCLHSE